MLIESVRKKGEIERILDVYIFTERERERENENGEKDSRRDKIERKGN